MVNGLSVISQWGILLLDILFEISLYTNLEINLTLIITEESHCKIVLLNYLVQF
jgi:hypothetical protein